MCGVGCGCGSLLFAFALPLDNVEGHPSSRTTVCAAAAGVLRGWPLSRFLGTFGRAKSTAPAGSYSRSQGVEQVSVSRETSVQQDNYRPQSVSKRHFSEPTVPTPHSLFVPPKRERAVDGTREKGGAPRRALRHWMTFCPQHCQVPGQGAKRGGV